MIASEHRLALPAGYQLGKYRFKSVLGAGGFGITYLADDQTLGRPVAIKELLPNDIATRLDGTTVVAKTKSEESNLAWARERFLEEGRALAACEHPNVVHVYEMIEANGTAYMVTKFEEGRSMAEWLTGLGHAPSEAELRGLLEPLLSGLDKVHRAGFLHRDIKPENIYITEDGRPLLLDFGSARQAVTDRSALLTSIVTTGYAPYEQYYEDGKQGPWSDLYALAGVMYRSIHGEKPPEATRRLKNDSCTRLAKKYSGAYSAQFLNAIDKALAVEYQDRPASVAVWRGMLGKGTVARPEAFQVSPLEVWQIRLHQTAEILRAYPWITAGAAGFGVLFCGWMIWKVVQPTPDPHPGHATPAPVAVVTPSPDHKAGSTPPSLPLVAVITPAPTTPVPTIPVPAPIRATPSPSVPDAEEVVEIDPKLVATWTARVKTPSGGYTTWHWEQLADGHYVSTIAGGPVLDTGSLTAQEGKIRRTSSLTHAVVDLTYEFKSDNEVTTYDPLGTLTWKRLGSGTGKSTASHTRSGNSSGESAPHYNIPDIRHIPIPRGFPFPH